jgi:outer membrane protein assembly factor BamB
MMRAYPTLRRAVALAAALLVFAAVLTAVAWSNRAHDESNRPRNSVAADAQTWPLWGGSVNRNMVNPFDKDMPTSWSVEEGAEKHIKWFTDLGDRAYGGPVIGDGKVFVGTNNKHPRNPRDRDKITHEPLDKGIVMCFRESDGQFLWQAVHDKLGAGRVNDWPEEGICSTPLVEGKRVYYVSNRAEVVCADTEGFLDGKNDGAQDEKYKDKTDADFIWRFDMIKNLNVFPHNLSTSSPLIAGDLLFVVTSNGVDEGHLDIPQPKAPSFICLNKKDGTLRWQSNLPSAALVEARKKNAEVSTKELSTRGIILMHGQWSSPVYAEVRGKGEVIFPGGNGWLYAFEPETGTLLWKFDCNPKDSRYELGGKGTRSDFIATPVVNDNKLYIGVGQDPEHLEGVGHLWCVDLVKATDKGATNKDHNVSPAGDNFDPQAEANKDSALHWHFGGFKKGGGRNPYVFGRTMASCAVHDGLCYAVDLGGHIFCLDADTGKEYWSHDMGSQCWSSPYWVDGKVYLGDDNGDLVIFQHGKEEKVLATLDMGGGVRATPVAANGVLYIMTENPGKIYAIK